MSHINTKRGKCSHFMSVFDNHSYCQKCRQKSIGYDVCVLKNLPQCASCISFAEYQQNKHKYNKQNRLNLSTSQPQAISSSQQNSVNSKNPPNMSYDMDFGKHSRVSSPDSQKVSSQNSNQSSQKEKSVSSVHQFDTDLDIAAKTKHSGSKTSDNFRKIVQKFQDKFKFKTKAASSSKS